MTRKLWKKEEINNILNLYEKNIPIKILAKLYNVTPNAISKTFQRYSPKHTHILDNKNLIYNNINHIKQWIKNNYYLFKPIFNKSYSIYHKTIEVNKILYAHGLETLNYLVVDNIFYELNGSIKNS